MITANDIQTARNKAVREINEIFKELEKSFESPEKFSFMQDDNFDNLFPLSFNPSEFKGKKPTSLIFGREKIPVYTWRMVFEKVMERCCWDANKLKALMELRGRVSGKARGILSDSPEGMRAPLQIGLRLYAETHYDTGSLLHVLLHRILDPVKFDYSDIYVTVRGDK